jgi:hypothetical protein
MMVGTRRSVARSFVAVLMAAGGVSCSSTKEAADAPTSVAQPNLITSTTSQSATSTTSPPALSTTNQPATSTTSATSVGAIGWDPLPAAPVEGRGGAASTWTGTELLIWGGFSGGPNPHPLADGAAYNPSLGTWRALHSAPDGMRGAKVAVAWTGKEALVLVGDGENGVSGARYNAELDSWAPIPTTPGGRRDDAGYVWANGELVVIGGVGGQSATEPGGVSYSALTDTWRVIETPAFVPRRATKLAWTGTEVVAFGFVELCAAPGPCGELRLGLAAYTPSTGTWRQLDILIADPIRIASTELPVQGLFVVDDLLITVMSRPARITTFNLTTGRSENAVVPVCAAKDDGKFQVPPILAGKTIVWVCGDGSVYQAVMPTMAWLPRATAPPGAMVSYAVFEFVGTGVVLWGGLEAAKFNPPSSSGAFLSLET